MAERSRIALCLGGGGITGAMYQVGVLAALEDAFEPFRATEFDTYVGAGSGAPIALALSGGITALRMYRSFLNPSDDLFALRRTHLLQVDGRELRRVASSAIGAARRMIGSYVTHPLETDFWNELDRFWDSLPAGIFSVEPFERFLVEFLARRGISNRFGELPRRLFVVANDLDEGRRTIFGPGHDEDVPVARAVAASCAVPVLYAPVRIGERDYVAPGSDEVAHVDVAVDDGARKVLVIHAAVPVRSDPKVLDVPTGHGPKKRVRDKGLLWVHSQTNRVESAGRLARGLEYYRKAHPDVDVHLVEPGRDEAALFLHSPMNYAARRAILVEAYTSTRRALRAPESGLRRALEGQGLAMREEASA